MDYNSFMTMAFAQGIPTEVLRTVEPWVQQEMRHWHGEKELVNEKYDLGFAELSDIQTVEQGFAKIKYYCDMWQVEGTRQYRKFLRDAGGREGKGVYRYVLKTYYLCQK